MAQPAGPDHDSDQSGIGFGRIHLLAHASADRLHSPSRPPLQPLDFACPESARPVRAFARHAPAARPGPKAERPSAAAQRPQRARRIRLQLELLQEGARGHRIAQPAGHGRIKGNRIRRSCPATAARTRAPVLTGGTPGKTEERACAAVLGIGQPNAIVPVSGRAALTAAGVAYTRRQFRHLSGGRGALVLAAPARGCLSPSADPGRRERTTPFM